MTSKHAFVKQLNDGSLTSAYVVLPCQLQLDDPPPQCILTVHNFQSMRSCLSHTLFKIDPLTVIEAHTNMSLEMMTSVTCDVTKNADCEIKVPMKLAQMVFAQNPDDIQYVLLRIPLHDFPHFPSSSRPTAFLFFLLGPAITQFAPRIPD